MKSFLNLNTIKSVNKARVDCVRFCRYQSKL